MLAARTRQAWAWRRAVAHPVVWSVPVMVLLVLMGWWFNNGSRFNDGFYLFWVNGDPQGDAQQHEWLYTMQIFRYTSGALSGQLLALLAGVALARRYRQGTALAVAVPLAVILAGVSFTVAYALAQTTAPLDDPVLVRVVLTELAAYPLYAAAGVGLSVLLGARRRVLVVLTPVLVVGWCVATMTGLLQDDMFTGPHWLLWTVPPIAAGTTVALAGLSIDVQSEPPVLVGDWGHDAGIILLVSAAAYALALNLLGGLAEWQRGRRRAGQSS